MNLEKAKASASKYDSRSSWSVGDPATYDWAVMNLQPKEWKDVTDHMHDSAGKILKGDPLDPRIVGWRRQISSLEKTYGPMTASDIAKIARLKKQVEEEVRC